MYSFQQQTFMIQVNLINIYQKNLFSSIRSEIIPVCDLSVTLSHTEKNQTTMLSVLQIKHLDTECHHNNTGSADYWQATLLNALFKDNWSESMQLLTIVWFLNKTTRTAKIFLQ